MFSPSLFRLASGCLLGLLWSGLAAGQEVPEPALPLATESSLESVGVGSGELLPDGSMLMPDGSADLAAPPQSVAELTPEDMAELEKALAQKGGAPKSFRFHIGGGILYDDNIFQTPDRVAKPKPQASTPAAPQPIVGNGVQVTPQQARAQREAQAAAAKAAKEAAAQAKAEQEAYELRSRKQADIALQAVLGASWRVSEDERSSLSIDYHATAYYYVDHSDLTGVNHDASLRAAYAFDRLNLGLDATYQRMSTATGALNAGDSLAGQQEDRDLVAATLSLAYELTGRVNLTSGLTYTTNQFESLQSSTDYSGRLGLTYALGPRTSVGFSGVFGYLDAETNAKQSYEQTLLTLAYEATDRLHVAGEIGLDFRHFGAAEAPEDKRPQVSAAPIAPTAPVLSATATPAEQQAAQQQYREQQRVYQEQLKQHQDQRKAADAVRDKRDVGGTETNFVFSVNGSYQLGTNTSITLRASKTFAGSAVQFGSTVDRTSFELGADRKLSERLSVSLSGGYEYDDFKSTVSGLADQTDRSESIWFGRVGVSIMPTSSSVVSLFYEYRNNGNAQEGLGYSSNRCGVSFGISF